MAPAQYLENADVPTISEDPDENTTTEWTMCGKGTGFEMQQMV
jgi:hypothetical protein